MRAGRTIALTSAVLAVVVVAGCAADPPPRAAPSPSAPSQAAPSQADPSQAARPALAAPSPAVPDVPQPQSLGPVGAVGCPTSYAAPDPDRPVLTASVTIDGRTVTASQRVVFTPDLPVDAVVFRLWAAGPRSRAAGAAVEVTRAAVDGVDRPTERPAPTLLRIPLPRRVPAGSPIAVDLDVRLRLPTGANERFGARGETSWLGSGLPLLAWERGRGWAEQPETANFAEATSSEVMEVRSLAVTRPAGLAVVATGEQVSDDGRTALFRAAAVRDVLVAVGRFRTATAHAAGGTPVTVSVAPGLADDPVSVGQELARALDVHAGRFGPYPYARLDVAVVPDLDGGVEYPAAMLLGTGQATDSTGSHEVAHEWWYGLVGANQGRDPWLDESFATYAEALDRDTGPRYAARSVPADGQGRVGAPMTYWEGRPSYFRSVYVQGAAMLLEARARAGEAAFDEALVCHVRRHAHRVTTPEDLAASLRHLPAALRHLRDRGALP